MALQIMNVQYPVDVISRNFLEIKAVNKGPVKTATSLFNVEFFLGVVLGFLQGRRNLVFQVVNIYWLGQISMHTKP